MKFDIYTDAGHGWLKVSKKQLKELCIAESISHYSYQRGDFAYLEEDCDLPKFVQAMDKIGKCVEYRPHHSNKSSKIRSYDRYLQPA
jgi:hypothetical protein